MIKINDDLSVDPAAVKAVYVSGSAPWNVILAVEVGNECHLMGGATNCASREEAQLIRRDIQHEINAALR